MSETGDGIIEYPIFGIAPSGKVVEGGGIVEGEDVSEETKKRIWILAQERQIEDTPSNRKLAFKIDSLVRLISNIKRFSILKGYYLISDDDAKNETLMSEIETFIKDIDLMSIFRQVFTPIQIEGAGHIQKLMEGNALTGFAVLENLTKHTDPTNIKDYYYYQNQVVSKAWRNPEESETETLRVWFIDEALRNEYTTIKADKDTVLSRDLIIEILNNEAGESNLQTILSFVFIKNYLLQLLPNIIEIVTSPSEEIIYSTVDKAGLPCIPRMPPVALKTADPDKYAAEVKTFEAWKSSLRELVNRIASDRTKQRKSVHPDTITEKILESNYALNSQMIESLIYVLDTQIAYGMNFSLSLINARGAELSTSQNIYSVIAVTMRGIQEQFRRIAQSLIDEKFPAAISAGIQFKLDELNPEDSLIIAQRNKLNAEVVEILNNAGFDPDTLNNFVSVNIDENLEFMSEQPSSETEEAAEKVIESMLDYRNQEIDKMEAGNE